MAHSDPVFGIQDFRGGLNTMDPPVKVRDNELTELWNMDPFSGSLEKRLGFTLFNVVGLPNPPISGYGFETDDGVRRILAQTNEVAKNVGATFQTRSQHFSSPGDGVFTVTPWYNTGTATIANGATAVTGAGGTEWEANLRTPGEFWIQFPNDATDAAWYVITAAGSPTGITLARAFEGTGGAGLTYRIFRPFAANLESLSAGVFKNNWFVSQLGQAPQRFDGTHMHFWGNLPSAAAPAVSAVGGGNVDTGVHRIVQVYDYGTFGKSVESADNTFAVVNPNTDLTVTVDRAPQACETIEVYAQLADAAVEDDYFLVGTVSNTAALPLTVSFNITDADLELLTVMERELGNVDQGNTLPPNITHAYFLDGRAFAIDPDNRDLLIISKVDLPGTFPTANSIQVQPEDGETPSGLTEAYGNLIILKDKSKKYYLTENSPNGGVESIPGIYGCVSSKSIKRWGGFYIFQSRQGVSAGTHKGDWLLSRKISPSMQEVKQAIIRLGKHTKTSVSELTTGATNDNTQINADGYVELITPLTNVEDDSDVDFDAGTFASTLEITGVPAPTITRYSLEGVDEAVVMAQIGGQSRSMLRDIANNNVDGSASGVTTGQVPAGWINVERANNGDNVDFSTTALARIAGETATLTVSLLNGDYQVNKIFYKFELVAASQAQMQLRVRIQTQDGTTSLWDTRATHTLTVPASTTITVQDTVKFNTTNIQGIRAVFDTITGVSAVRPSVNTLSIFEAGFVGLGTFTSQVLDTGETNPGMENFDMTFSEIYYEADTVAPLAISGNNVTASVAVRVRTGPTNDPNDGSWSLFQTQGIGDQFAAIVPATNQFGQFVQYELTLTNLGGNSENKTSSGGIRVDTVTISFFVEGTYTAAVIDTTESPPVRWGRFLDDTELNNGTIQASIRSGPVLVPDGTWTAFVNHEHGEFITVNEARFIQVRFILNAGTDTSTGGNSPRMHAFTVEWYSTTTTSASFPSTAEIYNDRYYLAVESADGTENDVVYVTDLTLLQDPQAMQQTGGLPWTRYEWSMNGMVSSGNTLYGFSSVTTQAFQLLEGYDDNGTIIRARFRSKIYLDGPTLKKFRRLYLEVDRTAAQTLFTLFINTSLRRVQAGFSSLPANASYAGGRVTDGAAAGQEKEPTYPGWTGALPINHNLSSNNTDYRLVGRGHFFQLWGQHLTTAVEPVRIHGFAVQYANRVMMGSP